MSYRIAHYPFPEFLTPDLWTIQPSQGLVAFVAPDQHIMQVPLGGDNNSRFVRCHEMLHIALSGPIDPNLSHDIFNAVEDCRINGILSRGSGGTSTGAGLGLQLFDDKALKAVKPPVKGLGAILWGMAAYGTTSYKRLPGLMEGRTVTIVHQLVDQLWGQCPPDKIPSLDLVRDITKQLMQHQGQVKPNPTEAELQLQDPLDVFSDPSPASPTDQADSIEQVMGTSTTPQPEKPEPQPELAQPEPPPQPEKSITEQILGDDFQRTEPTPQGGVPPQPPPMPSDTPLTIDEFNDRYGDVTEVDTPVGRGSGGSSVLVTDPLSYWPKPAIITPPRNKPSLDPKHGRKRRSFSEEGAIPGAMHRWPTDGAVFTTQKRGRSMSILCDVSGSMGLTMSEIQAFLNVAPASNLALYNHRHYYGKHPRTAPNTNSKLLVVAAKGRRISDKDLNLFPQGGSNGCDGTALRWLAKQRGPRIWISDGDVNSSKSLSWNRHTNMPTGNKALAQDCLDVCLDFRIRQFTSFDQFLEALHADTLDDWQYILRVLSPEDYTHAGCPTKRQGDWRAYKEQFIANRHY